LSSPVGCAPRPALFVLNGKNKSAIGFLRLIVRAGVSALPGAR
jgi:hypothetical protein